MNTRFGMFFVLALSVGGLRADIVSRDIGDPELNAWKAGDWVTCGGEITALDERPAGATGTAKALRLKVNYLPKRFGGWNAAPLVKEFPGVPKKMTAWMRLGNAESTGFDWSFEDSKGKKFKIYFKRPDGSKLELTRDWQECVAEFPNDITPPVKFGEAGQNNWGADQNPNPWSRILDVYDLRLHTEMGAVAAEDRPCGLSVDYPVEGSIYFHGVDKPKFSISAYSWTGGENVITFDAKTVTADGKETPFAIPQMKVDGSASCALDLPVKEPGAYKVIIVAKGFPKTAELKSRYVMCLPHRELSKEEKQSSFYGINGHGGTFVGYERWGRLGFSWFRDYAYTFDWMKGARGVGDYGGWPWYPKLVKGAEDAGMLTLACLMGSPRFPKDVKPGDPRLVPDNEWRRDIAQIVASFPTITAFELDNEEDLRISSPYSDFAPGYAAYHKALAEIVKAVRPDAWAVQEGSAGVLVDRCEKLVKDGTFADVPVCNGHHYCGVQAPEIASANLNTGMSKAGRSRLIDIFRRWRAASELDGKRRQLWLTEWGFDTLAGHVVSELEQAAYQQREWLLGMQGGLDKMFWYWLYDTDQKPKNFFDGCGLYDGQRYPKPSAAAFATIRAYIPGAFKYLGNAQLGSNHMVHMVEAEGRVVAAVFKIDKDGEDLAIDDPKAEKVTDMYGRTLKPGKRTLGIDPTWYVGLDRGAAWLKQCPIDVLSDFYVQAIAGEPVTVRVANSATCAYSIKAPEGWTVEKTADGFVVTPDATLPESVASIVVTGTSGDAKKVLPLDVDVVSLAATETFAAQLDGNFKVDILNQSSEPHTFTLKAELPAGWVVEPATFSTGEVKPGVVTTANYKLVSTAALKPGDAPKLGVYTENGDKVGSLAVIPRETVFRSVKPGQIKLDGKLDDWPAECRLGDFLFGFKDGQAPVNQYAAWTKEGLYVALEAKDSKCIATDPEWFWSGADCIELGIASKGGLGKDRKYEDTDAHFWLCPQADKGRFWAGRWGHDGRKTLKDADMPGVKSALKKTAKGYVAEFFFPAEVLPGWAPNAGDEIGFVTSTAIQGCLMEDFACWPIARRREPFNNAGRWAKVKLIK